MLRSLFGSAVLRRVGPAILPSAAAALICASWPTLDVQSSAHGLLRVLAAPGHGVVDDVVRWLRAPERDFLIAVLPMVIGVLFCLGGGLPPFGNGNASGVAWVLMVPAMVIGGRSVVCPVVGYAILAFVVLAVCFALADRAEAEPGFAKAFAFSDLGWMVPRSVLFAVAFVPFLPILMLLASAQRSVSWPDSKAVAERFPARRTESSSEPRPA